MPSNTSSRLLAASTTIMQRWEKRAIDEVLSALKLKSLALRDSLPELLNLIAHALSTTTSRSEARKEWEKNESLRVGRKHGQERACTQFYTMSQMIFEYHILRQVMCDVLEEDEILAPVDREVIVCAIEQAVNDASSQFYDTAKEAQENLAATLTHDLKGPLTVVSLATQRLLQKIHDPEYCRKAATRVMTNVGRLETMVENLLDVSRIKSGRQLTLRIAEVDLARLLHELEEDFEFKHEGRVRISSQVVSPLHWDGPEVIRLIENLVSNAVKYGQPGAPVTVCFVENPKSVTLSIHNEGTPIPADQHASLFQEFHRGPSKHQHKGWGIGLTVVKGIVEAHRGQIAIESSAGAGTTFTVDLPKDAT